MRLMWQALSMLAAAYAGLLVLVYFLQSHMVFYPEVEREVSATPALAKLPFEDLHLHTSDGVDLHGWYVPAARAHGTVLFLHGNAGNISHRLDFVEMFHRLGYNTLIFDYRGYGNSSGTSLPAASCCTANRWAAPLPHGSPHHPATSLPHS